MKTMGFISLVAGLLLVGSYGFAAEQKSPAVTKSQKTAVSAPAALAPIAVTVKCPPKAGVKTYGDGGWMGVDHANAYPFKSHRLEDKRILCTYAGPQGFEFDLMQPEGAYKNCVAQPGGVFECQK